MSLYRYIAAAPGETPHEILIEADSLREAQGKLRSRHLTPVQFCGEAGIASEGRSFWRKNKIDTCQFTRQLAPLLAANIQLERALAIIADSSAEPEQKQFVNSLRQGLHEGKKFSDLIRSHGKLFPGYYANLVESGEESGCLPQAVEELYKFMSENKELKGFIVSSSVYPLAILGVTLLVTILLFTVFVPKFAKIFADMGREMPASMNFLMGASNVFFHALWVIPVGFFTIWFLLRKFWGKELLHYRISKLKLKIPALGKIMVDLEMCRYIRTLAILLANHVEIIRTVKIAEKIIVNPVISEGFRNIDRKLKGGEKLSAALSGNRFVPTEMVPMLRVGEETGEVGQMLERIASNLEADTRAKIKRMLSLFEPAVIVFLAVIVLIVVVSIFAAMMEINSIN
ncbi:MAG: type II secretion system F family protein [Lentisphaerae bacterium]|nr:type II secretion system F family protein [Lentisphaerota bacterium]